MKIVLNEHQITYLVQEALALDKAREYAKIQRSPEVTQKIDELFNKIKQKYPNFRTSKRGDRLYIPYGSSLEPEIKKALMTVKYKSSENDEFPSEKYMLKSFDDGIVLDAEYNRDVKLGKVLTKIGREDLLTRYTTNKSKGVKDTSGGFIVFSKHPYDIAGMSTGRDWSSCMNLDTGANRRYVSCDITEGSFVLYLIDKNDLNIKKPEGRLLIKPFINKFDKSDIIFFPEGRSYGSLPVELQQEINNLFNEFNKETKGVMYSKNEKLYSDSITNNFTNLNKVKTLSDVDAFIFDVNDNIKQELALQSEIVKDYIMMSGRISHYVKEGIIENSKYVDIEKYLTPEFLSRELTTKGLDKLIERFPHVRKIMLQNLKLFENFGKTPVLLKYFPEYVKNLSFKKLKEFSPSQFFDILYYNPEMFDYFYPKFKDKMVEDQSKLTYFLEEHPEYIVKSYPIFKPLFRKLTHYNLERFIASTLTKSPQLFNFYLNNEKEQLDKFFSEPTLRNEVVFRNNRLFYLVHNYYPKFVQELVDDGILKMITQNESLIPFFAKFYRDSFSKINDYDMYRFLYYHMAAIPYMIKYYPEGIKIIGDYNGKYLMDYYPQFADDLSKIFKSDYLSK